MLMSLATSVMAGFVFFLSLIISDGSTRSPFLKSKGTSLGRGASKIKTRSVSVTCEFMNWNGTVKSVLQQENVPWLIEKEHGVVLAPIKDPSFAKSPGSLAVFYETMHRILGK